MDFISNSKHQVEEMLKTIGVESIDALFSDIPGSIKLSRPNSDDGLSEFEGLRLMERIGSENSFHDYDSYLGAGAYEHHIPAIVAAICSKSEFLTAYTPYQAEASQGMLQSIFEYQSVICALTGMDVSNASVYDASSACAEGALMAIRANKGREKILLSDRVHPHYRDTVQLYTENTASVPDESLLDAVDDETAAVIIQYPNFYGEFTNLETLIASIHKKGALAILCGHLLPYGILKPPGELGADIAVGSTQPFGIPLQFGGPYVGYIACKQSLVRQLPGRLVGETVDTEGRRGFVLTLQAREQHIRREKATSNICSNQALAALASLIAILWYGKEGVKELALTNFQRASYLKNGLEKLAGISTDKKSATFNEFVVHFEKPLKEVLPFFTKRKVIPGLELTPNSLLVAVTETKNIDQLNAYIAAAKEATA